MKDLSRRGTSSPVPPPARCVADVPETTAPLRDWPRLLAWLPIPLLLTVIAALWVADLRTAYESRLLMVLLNLFFTWLASLCICFLTARGFLRSGQPGLLMFGCGSLLWGFTSLAAAMMVDRLNPTITVHNVGVLGAAFCHLVGLLWRGRLPRPGRWLVVGYASALATAALIVWVATAGLTPVFFVQGHGGTPIRQVVLLLAIALFASVAWQMIYRFRRHFGAFYYWYGLGLALVATGLTGVMLLSVQGGILGWTNRLTQYLGSAYLFIAALMAARGTGTGTFSLTAVDEALQKYWFMAEYRRQQPLQRALRYGAAVVAVAAGFGLRLALEARFGPGLPPYITFYPAIMVVALLAGFGPCLLAMALALLVVGHWVMPRVGQVAFTSPVDRLGLVIFAGMGLFMGVVAEFHRRYRNKATAYDREVALRASREALRDSEERMQMALQISRSFAFEWELTTDRVSRSDSCGRVLGVSGDDLRHDTGQGYFQRVHPEDRARFVQMLGELNPSADVYHTEYRLIRGDGTTAVLEESARGFFDADGKLRRLVGVTTDTTERKRAEDAVRRKEADLSEAQRLAHIGHWYWDAKTDVTTGSDELLRIYGFDPAIQSMPDFGAQKGLCYPDADWERVNAAVQRTLQTGDGYELDVPAIRAGVPIWVTTRGEGVRDADGRIVGLRGTVQDITDRKRTEEALTHAKALAEVANAAKSRFLANISHELRTPMNAILGMVDMALAKQVDPSAMDFLTTAKESADLLLALLDDLLDSAKIEAGKLELESAPFSLRRVLDQTTQVLAVRASERGLAFSCRIAPEVPDALVGDQVRLRQILLNLAGNGIKFTERGEVMVSVRTLPSPFGRRAGGEGLAEIASSPDSPHPSPLPEGEGTVNLEFSVRDTGIGIPPSKLDSIFRPFIQADPSTTRRFGGTGLGLAICASLVEMMEGRIWAESEPGHGSTFHFTVRLPLAKELPAAPEERGILASAASALRILLVEDNPANQKVAAYLLQERGHTVDIAGDGQQGLCLTRENQYDVILMDVQMPGMDGLETTKAIRNREVEKRRVPIIAMTAHAMKGDRERCLAAGMDGYLSKPIDARETIALVERLAAAVPTAKAGAVSITSSPTEPASPPAAAVFDPELALTRCLSKPALLQKMIAYFFKDADNFLPQMRAALHQGDLVEVGRLGHRLKGTVANVAGEAASEAASRVEYFLLHAGEQSEADDAVRAFEGECKVLRAALIEYQAATSSLPTDP